MSRDAGKKRPRDPIQRITPRDFALDVVRRLRSAGHQAVWAGGCVRDQLLQLEPTDYDVATDAPPDKVQAIFGKRQTLAVGAAFGVVVVFARRRQAQVEVATFRQDAEYSDGRHPDSVSFSSDREDALRRDFTINGLFYDPISEQVIDYVGGEADLRLGIIRAIGEPWERFREDKLRMLRAVRFASTFGFEIDPPTLSAVQQHAQELNQVSAERIAAELRLMLVHPNRRVAVELLRESQLLSQVFPDLAVHDSGWRMIVQTLDHLAEDDQTREWTERQWIATSLACLFRSSADRIRDLCLRLRLSKEEYVSVQWLVDHEQAVINACELPWPQIQRILIQPLSPQLVCLADAGCLAATIDRTGVDFCRQKLQLTAEQLNPTPLITGDDLVAHGFKPSPAFRDILEAVRDAQLTGKLRSREAAMQFVDQWRSARD